MSRKQIAPRRQHPGGWFWKNKPSLLAPPEQKPKHDHTPDKRQREEQEKVIEYQMNEPVHMGASLVELPGFAFIVQFVQFLECILSGCFL